MTQATRRLLAAATALVLLAGLSLSIAPERTDEWFAWTVTPPVTATVLGAAYLASAVVEAMSARARVWANARVAVPSVFTFTALTFVVTVIHLDKFHVSGAASVRAQTIAWGWIAIYAAVPLIMALIWWRQLTVPGQEPPRTRPLPVILLATCVGMALMLAAQGLWMLLTPTSVAEWWPWELTPLTGRAMGAWLVGLAVSAVGVVAENDTRRVRPVAVGAIVLPVLVGAAVARFSSDIDLTSPPALAMGAVLLIWAAIGAVLVGLDAAHDRGGPSTRQPRTGTQR